MADLFTSAPVVAVAATPFLTVDIGIPRFFGPFRRSGDIWAAGYYPNNPRRFQVGVVKSSDAGATWALQDQSNTPTDHDEFDFAFGPTLLSILSRRSGGLLAYNSMDMSSGLFGTAITSSLAAGFTKLALYNSNPIAMYNNPVSGGALLYSIVSAGVFGGAVTLVAGVANYNYAPLSTILDPATGTLHILYQRNRTVSVASQDLWYVALDSGGGISTPVQIASRTTSWNTPIGTAQGAIWMDSGSVKHLLWAVRGPDDATVLTLYDGANISSPVWTTNTLSIGSSVAATTRASDNANVIVSGGVPYIFWYRQATTGPDLSRVEYCTWDGSAFSAILTAWDVIANSVGGVTPSSLDIDAYSITANGSGWDLMADAYVNPSFDQSLVFLTAGGGPTSGSRNKFTVRVI